MIWSTLGFLVERAVCVCLLLAVALHAYVSCVRALESRPARVACSCSPIPWWQECTEASEKMRYGSPYCQQQEGVRELVRQKMAQMQRQWELIGATQFFPPFPLPPLPNLALPSITRMIKDAMVGVQIVPDLNMSCEFDLSGGLGDAAEDVANAAKSVGTAVASGASSVASTVASWF